MKLIREINLINNKKLVIWLNVATIPLVVAFLALFTVLASKVVPYTHNDFSGWGMLAFLALFFLLIVIHEGIHGLFFKVFNPKGKVKFGLKNGMAYATSPQSFYTKVRFAWISLAPFTLITLGLFILLLLRVMPVFYFVLMAAVHGASCIGDFYWIWLLIRAPKDALVEDTEQGINFYEKITDR